MAGLRLIPLLIALLAALPAPGAAQARPDLEAQRRRWQSMSAEERARVQERYEQFQSLSDEDRRAVLERAEEVRRMRQRVYSSLAPEDRRRLEELSPHERDRRIQDQVVEEARTLGRELRDSLPPLLLDELERTPARGRPALLQRFRAVRRSQASVEVIKHLARALELSKDEARAIAELPMEERRLRVMELLRRLIERHGILPGVEPAEWESWRELSDDRFVEEFYSRLPPWRRHPGSPFGIPLPPFGRRPGGGPPPAHLAPDARADWERLGLLEELHDQSIARITDRLNPAPGSPAPSRERVFQQVRRRCLEFLDRHPVLPADARSELAALEGRVFGETLRNAVRDERGAVRERLGLPDWRRRDSRGDRPADGGRPPWAPRAVEPDGKPRERDRR